MKYDSLDDGRERLDDLAQTEEAMLANQSRYELTKAQAAELDARVAQYQQNPEDVIPWERLKEALSGKKQKGGE